MKEIFKLNNFQKSQKEIIENELINGNEQFLENDEAHEDFIYDYYEKFLNNIEDDEYSKKIWEDWQDKFVKNPNNFFTKENYHTLSELESADRLARLFQSTRSLYVTPQMIEDYFKQFPDDAEVAYLMWQDNDGNPKTNAMFEFFGTCAKVIATKDKNPQRDKRLEQYLEIAERKNLAPQVLIGNYEENGKLLPDVFKKFGKSADGLLNAFSEAAELMRTGDHFIDAKQIFTPDFEKIKEEDKAEFLRLAIIQFHQALIFEEVWNSAFTKDLVEMKKNNKNKVWFNSELERKLAMPDVAHSYTFRTYQPMQAFSLNQEYFDVDMDRTVDQGGFIEEYPFHRLLLASIDKLGKVGSDKDKNTDLLVEFWDKNRNPIFANSIADALSKQNPNRAASKLLEAIRNEPEDKSALAAILYRLELGQIGISKEGAQYLEKIYDLGLYNNPDYHVSRLTPDGEVGIFNEEKELIKYYELGDLTTSEKQVKAQVLDITYDTLFIAQENEKEEEKEKRLQYLEEFKKKYYHLAQDKIFQETDVKLNNLSFKEQGWYIISLQNSTEEEKENLIKFTKEYNEEGIKTFLSLNRDERMGQKIIAIGEFFKDKGAHLVFKKYNAIVKNVNQIDDYLFEYFDIKDEQNKEEIKNITNSLLKKAQDILIQYAQKVESGGEITYEEVVNELSEISEQIILFSSVYKFAFKDRIELADIKGVELNKFKASDLSNGDRQEILKIFQNNRTNYPKTLLKNNTEQLQQAVLSGDDRFYTMKVNRELTSFIRFSDLADGNVYIGSFNVRPEAKSSAIGDALIKTTLEQEGKEKVIEGVVYSKHPKFDSYIKYLESLDFKIVGEIDDYEGTGEKFYKIERQPNTQKTIKRLAA